ncbi:YbbR-like domain-containing protein [Paenibacillus contaminans]|uniref:YbbR-like domain-containing protein n=1 Tax=Paenibacillus contaminans TaxID=450362 RepID=A0A329M696_9BACL|nr:CdaR family protein [Paenibacillus contaminans]RAV15288.1 hypothetical protein DQG23_30255 [Paenibacillus contaminans]
MDKWLRNNNVVKGIALVIGILLWVVVHLDVQTTSSGNTGSTLRNQTISNVSIVAKYDQELYSLRSIQPAEVTVVLSGRSDAVRKVDTAKIRVELDLTQMKSGVHSLPVKVIGAPSTVTAEATPAFVRAELEEMQMKQVPVTINVAGTPAEGYKAGQPVVKPTRVQVTVPESQINAVESARGEVSVDKANGAVTKQVKLVAYDKNGKKIDGVINPQVVDVEVPITSPLKAMPLQVKFVGRPAQGFSVASVTKPEQVTVFGPQDILDKMEFYDGLQIDLNGLKEDRSLSVDVPLKKGVTRVDPAKAEIKIAVVPSATKVVEKVPITLIGQSEGYTAKLISPEGSQLAVTVEGAPALLDKLKPQDIQAVVDVTNAASGTQELPITLNLPPFLMQAAQQPALKAVVEITANQPSKPVTGGESTETPTAPPAGGSGSPTPSPTPVPSPTASSGTATITPTQSKSSESSGAPAGGDGKKTN